MTNDEIEYLEMYINARREENHSIERYWKKFGRKAFPQLKEIHHKNKLTLNRITSEQCTSER